MSYTSVISVWPGEKTEVMEELTNAWGSAPVVWGGMSERYLGKKFSWFGDDGDLWPLPGRLDIPECNRAVLTMTYDNMIVLKKDYQRAAQSIRQFLAYFPVNEKHINHWPRIAEIFESNPKCPAIGFWITSVCENPFTGEWDEESDDYSQPDWNKFWDAFKWLDAQETRSNGE